MRRIAITAWLMLGCGSGQGVVHPAPSAWALTWSDEFSGAAGSAPDPSRWVLETGRGPNNDGWGNAELQTYTDSPDNVSHDGAGNLVITARKPASGPPFTSARLKTQGTFAQRYGRFEARVKLPAGKGLWPAFWMLGSSITDEGWPACGEIDIVELRGQQPATAVGTLHGPEYFGSGAISKKFTLSSGTLDADFHLYAVEWDPALITFWVDDQLYQTVAAHTVLAGSRTWVYDQPFFLLLNLAVGGSFLTPSGQPDATTPFPNSMVVDYVRAYQRVP